MGSHSETPNTQHPKHQAIRMKLGGVLLSSLLSLFPGSFCDPEAEELRRVKEGQEYKLPQQKPRQGKGLQLSDNILEEEFTDCRRGEGTQSLHQFTTEDIEKQHNVSLSDYRGQVLLVVNLASF